MTAQARRSKRHKRIIIIYLYMAPSTLLLLLLVPLLAQQVKQYTLCAINSYQSGDCLLKSSYLNDMPFCGGQLEAPYICMPQRESVVFPFIPVARLAQLQHQESRRHHPTGLQDPDQTALRETVQQ